MREATLCLLVRGDPPAEILLGMKKIGFGQGKYNGFGGKVQTAETVEKAAVRELAEETGVKAAENDLDKVAHLTFLFPHREDFNQVVHVFLVRRWRGAPVEGVEMRPAWFCVDEIPFESMWDDDAHWLPLVLAGKRVRGVFTYQEDNETVATAEMGELALESRSG
jgi:8-oxo-dGTP diphosphatase